MLFAFIEVYRNFAIVKAESCSYKCEIGWALLERLIIHFHSSWWIDVTHYQTTHSTGAQLSSYSNRYSFSPDCNLLGIPYTVCSFRRKHV
jgi:hypothetical protein